MMMSGMLRRTFGGVALLVLVAPIVAGPVQGQEAYYPPAGGWEHRAPGAVGMDSARLAAAVAYAQEHEAERPRDLELEHYISFGREPNDTPIGPFRERGDQTGIVVRHGYIVAEWGEPDRVDMTFSVTKSFLSTTVGLAWDRGLIAGVHDPVGPYVPAEHFASPHNARITWDHMLRQTSDWEGTLWGKPDWADRPPPDVPLAEYVVRERNEPGTVYKYNDVRVNMLALAALHVWRRPLPEVLRTLVMDPIGASNTWRWLGYDNSWVTIDGIRMQSVSGGGHWGGGMFISARDLARFGLLTLRRGQWNGEQVLSDEWFAMALAPTAANPGYGFMNFFLNTGRRAVPSAPESAFYHLGSGANVVYVDPEHDLVIVARWIEGQALAALAQHVLEAVID
jgi:CubicO group peptidase (beta-lactamase class C family)